MGIMAGNAAILDRRVNSGEPSRRVVVALQAKIVPLGQKHFIRRTGMRVVAGSAVLGHNRMNHFFPGTRVFMTLETKLVPGSGEHLGRIPGVGIVATDTAIGDYRVLMLPLFFLGVTHETEVITRLKQHIGAAGLMRTMTTGTTVHKGGMDGVVTGRLAGVAKIAKINSGHHQGEGSLFAGVFFTGRLVTDGTLTGFNRAMHHRSLSHNRVTISGHAAFCPDLTDISQ